MCLAQSYNYKQRKKCLPDPALRESQTNENHNYVKCKGKRYCAVRPYDRRF